MPRSFFAICLQPDRHLEVFRIPLSAGVQAEMEMVFDGQEQNFLKGRDEIIPFDGDWKPDSNQLLALEDDKLAQAFNETLVASPATYDELDITDYENAGIKGIFTRSTRQDGRLLLQRFQTSQYLQRNRLTLVFSNNQFGKLAEHGFALDTNLTALVEGSTFKFRSFSNLRTILPIQDHFIEATDEEVDEFLEDDCFMVESPEELKDALDERARKLIHGIAQSGVLQKHSTHEILNKAQSVGLQITISDDRLVLPSQKRELKTLLSFLEESVYRGVFSDETFETNSKRKVQQA